MAVPSNPFTKKVPKEVDYYWPKHQDGICGQFRLAVEDFRPESFINTQEGIEFSIATQEEISKRSERKLFSS